MKYIIALPVSWFLWLLGDIACRILDWRDTERWVGFWYFTYNGLMIASSDVQEWAGGHRPLFPWGDPP